MAITDGTVFSFGVLPELNKVGVTLGVEDDALVRELETLVPADALHIEVSPGLKAEAT